MNAAAEAQARLSALAEAPRNWAREGTESLVAALKIVSDLTAQEIALVMGMLRERATFRPAASAVETAGSIAGGLTGAGKILLDLATSETAVMVDGLKEGLRMSPSMAALADLVPQGMATFADSQKRLLDSIATLAKDVSSDYAEGEPLMAREKLTKMLRERFECFVEAQKTFLDQVEHQVTIATEGRAATPAARDRSKILARVARDSVEKFTEAQKELVDLAVKRLESGDGRARDKAEPKRTSLAELTRKSVRNFTAAEKSLLDLAVKPPRKVAEHVEARPRRRRPRPRKPAVQNLK